MREIRSYLIDKSLKINRTIRAFVNVNKERFRRRRTILFRKE